jgi:hypothetical protein
VSVRDALLLGTEYLKFVKSMRCFAAEDREKGQLWWMEWRLAAEQLAPFDGTKEELEVVMTYVQGKRMLLRKGARLTVCSDQRAACVNDLP